MSKLLYLYQCWQYFEEAFIPLFSEKDTPRVPIRLMVVCLLLKHLKNLGDDSLPKVWVENPYMQYFCGIRCFEHKIPFAPGDFCHFRKRIGEAGFEKIFACSLRLYGKKVDKKSRLVLLDTTVHVQCQCYTCENKQLLRDTYNRQHPKRAKVASCAVKRLRTIAGHQVRELERKMSKDPKARHASKLDKYRRVIHQRRHDKDKLYSLHKPFTRCIAKGRSHRENEFGNQVGLITTGSAAKRFITAVKKFLANPYDGHTIRHCWHRWALTG
jgi:IS5 family transposase